MKAPDTIYIQGIDAEFSEFGEWATTRHADTDIAFVRTDQPYDLAKTVEAQKAEIEDLRDLLASTSLEAGAEIARLRQLLTVHGRHTYACKQKYGPRHDCTCGFTAALASPPAAVDPAEAEKLHQEGVALANLFRQIQPPRDAEEPPVQKRAKGSYGAECNRASCKTALATWKHRDMDRYYCQPCGMWINENNSDCDPPLCGPVAGDAT